MELGLKKEIENPKGDPPSKELKELRAEYYLNRMEFLKEMRKKTVRTPEEIDNILDVVMEILSGF